ncbi:MAG TPA: amidase [Solirubrobacterales bacterium]|nr:amidase [Solirubrobacterales bacterium]
MAEKDLAFAGLARLAEAVRGGEVSPRELVQLYLERIGRLDPQLNAFRVVRAEPALAAAVEAEKRRHANDEAPLLGVPIAVKDSADVAGELTTHGTGCIDEAATEDCEMVKRLRAAGAIVIGKTNLPELAYAMFTESPTWGVTRNPWNLGRTPGGSSGGSGAAVAAGLVAAATASDGAGSIRYPAAYCSIFGLKPQRGRIPVDPDVEHWHGMSVNGCLTRTVLDTALFLDATAGGGKAPDKPPTPERPFADAARTPPGKLRIAVSVKATRALAPPILQPPCRQAVEETAKLLGSLGHEVGWRDPDWGMVGNGTATMYARGVADDARRLPNRERLGRQAAGVARLGSLIPDWVLRRARAAIPKHAARINRIFDEHDVLLLPVVGEPPVPVGKWDSHRGPWTLAGMTRRTGFGPPWNYLGNPAAAVPAGFTEDGLPLSVQLVGRPNDEATLLSLAAQLEAERPWADRLPPIS